MVDKSAVTPSRQPSPTIAYCSEKQRLLTAFCDALEQLTMLQDQQVPAVIHSNDNDFTGFDSLIRLAQKKKIRPQTPISCT
jgi:hypothetical protein